MSRTAESPEPYRVEWRLHIGMVWTLVEEVSSHDDALELARKQVKEYQGFTRVVTQHVIERFDCLKGK